MGLLADDGAIARLATKITYSGSAMAGVISIVNRLDWVAVLTGVTVVGIFSVNRYYKRRRHADEHAESLRRQRLLELETQAKIVAMGHHAEYQIEE